MNGREAVILGGFIELRDRRGAVVGVALVDADIRDELMQWRWSLDYRGYAIRNTKRSDGKQRTVRMHRQVLDALGDPREVDHINRVKLDNRRTNLRLVTHLENNANRGPRLPVPQSMHVGVTWDRLQKRWVARIRIAGTARRIGSFNTEDAARSALDAYRQVTS